MKRNATIYHQNKKKTNEQSRKNWESQKRRKSPEQADVTNEIEEQLRRQRIKHHETLGKNEVAPRKKIGKYYYDEIKQAYFPESSFPSKKQTSCHPIDSTEHVPTRQRYPPFMKHRLEIPLTDPSVKHMTYLASITSSSSQRARLLDVWMGKRLLNNAVITPSTIAMGASWFSLLQRDYADIYPKMLAPAWTRTFDVLPSMDNCQLPYVATLVHNGTVLRRPNKPNFHYEVQSSTTRLFYFEQGGRIEPHICIITKAGNASRLLRYREPDRRISIDHIPFPVNDFTCRRNGKETYLATNHKWQAKCNLFSLDCEQVNLRPKRMTIECFPQSDSLCIEIDPYNKDDLSNIFVGHRNGQVTMVDCRQQKICHSTHDTKSSGAICNITFLQNHFQLLARGSFGCCRLFDIRKVGMPLAKDEDPSVILRVSVSDELTTPHLTSKCSGVTTNPSETTIVSPFVTKQAVPSLAFWSIHSGEYLGSKELGLEQEHETPASSTWGVSWVELCSKTTNAWKWKVSDQSRPVPKRVDGAFGLWYKCGQTIAGVSSPIDGGSIHHVYMNEKRDLRC